MVVMLTEVMVVVVVVFAFVKKQHIFQSNKITSGCSEFNIEMRILFDKVIQANKY